MLSLLDLETKLNLAILLDNQRVNVLSRNALPLSDDVLLNLGTELLLHALLFLVHGHLLLHLFILEVKIVSNSPLVDIGFKRRLDQGVHATNEGFVHHVLVAQVRHLI